MQKQKIEAITGMLNYNHRQGVPVHPSVVRLIFPKPHYVFSLEELTQKAKRSSPEIRVA